MASDQAFQHFTLNRRGSLLALLFSVCLCLGVGFNTYLAFDQFKNPDSVTYLNTANGHFQDQSPVRRYRVVVPWLAQSYSKIVLGNTQTDPVYTLTDSYKNPKLLKGFFHINALLMAVAAWLIFRICIGYGASAFASALAVVFMLCGSQWGGLFIGHPFTDSFYLLTIAATVWGLQSRNNIWLAVGCLLGCVAKESFILFIPFILLAAKGRRGLPTVLLLGGVLLQVLLRWQIDRTLGLPVSEGLSAAGNHIYAIRQSLQTLCSLNGLRLMITVFGLAGLLPLVLLLQRSYRKQIKQQGNVLHLLFLFIVLAHALLSTELYRMFYFSAPVIIPLLAVSFDYLARRYRLADITS